MGQKHFLRNLLLRRAFTYGQSIITECFIDSNTNFYNPRNEIFKEQKKSVVKETRNVCILLKKSDEIEFFFQKREENVENSQYFVLLGPLN